MQFEDLDSVRRRKVVEALLRANAVATTPPQFMPADQTIRERFRKATAKLSSYIAGSADLRIPFVQGERWPTFERTPTPDKLKEYQRATLTGRPLTADEIAAYEADLDRRERMLQ